MSIIHELQLENKDSIDSNQRNMRKKTQNFCACYDGELACVPSHSFKIKLGKTKDESRNMTYRHHLLTYSHPDLTHP